MGDYVNRLARFYDVVRDMPRIRTRLPQFQEDDFSDDAFFKRFRFTNDGFNHLVNFVGDDIPEPENNRGRPLSPRTQLHALRYYATGSFQIVHGECPSHRLQESSEVFWGFYRHQNRPFFQFSACWLSTKLGGGGGGGGNAHYHRHYPLKSPVSGPN